MESEKPFLVWICILRVRTGPEERVNPQLVVRLSGSDYVGEVLQDSLERSGCIGDSLGKEHLRSSIEFH